MFGDDDADDASNSEPEAKPESKAAPEQEQDDGGEGCGEGLIMRKQSAPGLSYTMEVDILRSLYNWRFVYEKSK